MLEDALACNDRHTKYSDYLIGINAYSSAKRCDCIQPSSACGKVFRFILDVNYCSLISNEVCMEIVHQVITDHDFERNCYRSS